MAVNDNLVCEMDRKKREKTVFISILTAALLLGCFVGVAAAFRVYVNDGERLNLDSGAVFAIGSSGTEALASGRVYALTASGVEALGELEVDEPEPEPSTGAETGKTDDNAYTGGGGLVPAGGKIGISSSTVFVGLRYSYSGRDSTVKSANLENAVGEGYEFGYFTASRAFVAEGETDEVRITMRPTSGGGVAVYSTDSGELLYEASNSGAGNMLAVRPAGGSGSAQTWFSGYKYHGSFGYYAVGGQLCVVNALPLETYVAGVCASEMGASFPAEALKAQAVAARTFAANYIMRSGYYTSCGFDLTADTYCQAYSGCGNVTSGISSAVSATRTQVLTYNGRLIDAQYFSSSGGGTEDNENVNGNSNHPYLRGVIDPYEQAVSGSNYYSSWSYLLSGSTLGSRAGIGTVISAEAEYSDTGNVIALELTDSYGRTAVLRRSQCRSTLGLPSLHYSVEKESGGFRFTGSGWGHSLGMSQFGAYAMAAYYNFTYKDILGFYYTGVGISYGDY